MVHMEKENNKIFRNIDIDLQDTFQLAETESTLWIKAQTYLTQRVTQTREVELTTLPHIPGGWCFAVMERSSQLLGTRLIYTLEGFDQATNTRASLSLLHSELEVLI